jgi:hypothetical protein
VDTIIEALQSAFKVGVVLYHRDACSIPVGRETKRKYSGGEDKVEKRKKRKKKKEKKGKEKRKEKRRSKKNRKK